MLQKQFLSAGGITKYYFKCAINFESSGSFLEQFYHIVKYLFF